MSGFDSATAARVLSISPRSWWGPYSNGFKEPEAFKRFRIDPQFHTLVWPNGADIAPELLYDRVKRVA